MELLQEHQTDRSREYLLVVDDGKFEGPRAMIACREASQHAWGLVSHMLQRGDLAAVVHVGVECGIDRDCGKVLVRKGGIQRVEDHGHSPDSDGLGAKVLVQTLESVGDEPSPSGVADGDATGDAEPATHGCGRASGRVLALYFICSKGLLKEALDGFLPVRVATVF